MRVQHKEEQKNKKECEILLPNLQLTKLCILTEMLS
jgi:hypothetical protein